MYHVYITGYGPKEVVSIETARLADNISSIVFPMQADETTSMQSIEDFLYGITIADHIPGLDQTKYIEAVNSMISSLNFEDKAEPLPIVAKLGTLADNPNLDFYIFFMVRYIPEDVTQPEV